MAMDGKILAKARESLAARKKNNEDMRLSRELEVYRRVPAVREKDAQMRAALGQLISVTASRAGAEALQAVQKNIDNLLADKMELLVSHGYSEDYLEDIYTCPHCHDSGYLPTGAMCDCLKEAYEAEKSKRLNEALKLGEESFADFSLNYYSGTAKAQMEIVLNTCKQYAVQFGANSENLLFRGGTGLGKTFLSACIAKVVSAQGCSVAYETALDAFAAFEDQKFSRDAETYAEAGEKVKRILNCDLLVLDDLGTELTTSFTQSALYNIVNSRLSAGKKTIISTNLSAEEMQQRYLPQTISRIGGEYLTLPFAGEDIRAIRKRQRVQ